MNHKIVLVIMVIALAISVIGCNMLRGAGKDVENAGGSIQRTVNHND